MSIGVLVLDDEDSEKGLVSAGQNHGPAMTKERAASKSLKTLKKDPRMRDGFSSIGETPPLSAL
jgi:hypothetical protein